MLDTILTDITSGKYGVEIGGPSGSANDIIYNKSAGMDNVIFSSNTIWSQHTSVYRYYPGETGKVIVNDAVNISQVKDKTYDFCFASHSLEHIANPLKALKEWIRVTKDGAHIILILPEKTQCFDHNRSISSFATLLAPYEKDVGEDDLSTLPEILEKHDLSMDKPAGNLQQFTQRSMNNINNRCLHHYVYSPDLLKEICEYMNCDSVSRA